MSVSAFGGMGGGLGGAVIGRAVVELVGDTAKLQKDVQLAQTKTETATKGMAKSTTGFSSVAKVAMGVAALAFVSFVAKGATSLQRIEKINAQTESVIKSTGSQAGVTATQVEGLAGSIEDLTSVEAESVQEGANLLLTFTQVKNQVGEGNDIFDQAVGIMTDMSVALGTDMKGSAIQLGKALNDPIKGMTALRRVGVSFTQEQIDMVKEMVESNRVLDAQKLILRELNVEFGGSAEALGQTTAGKIQLFRHAVGSASEALAGALLPAMLDVAEAATDVTESLLPIFEVLSDLLGIVLTVVAWLGKLAGAADGVGLVVILLTAAIAKLVYQNYALAASNAVVTTSSAKAATSSGGFLSKVAGLGPATLAWAGASVAVGIALSKLGEFLDIDNKKADEYADAVMNGTTTLQALHDEISNVAAQDPGAIITNPMLYQSWTMAVEETRAAIDKQNREILAGTGLYQEWGGVLGDVTNQNARLHASLAGLILSLDIQKVKLSETDEALIRQKVRAGDLQGAINILSRVLGLTAGEQKELSAATDDAAQAFRDQKQARDALAGGLLGLVSSIDSVQDTQRQLNDLEKAGKRGTEEYKDAKLQLLQSQLGVNDGLRDYMQDLRDSGRDQQFAIDKVFALGRQVGLTRQEVRDILGPLSRYRQELDDIPEHVGTTVTTTYQRRGIRGQLWHEGGHIPGSGDVPIVGQGGEYVVRRAAVQRVGVATLDRINRMHEGGQVEDAPRAPTSSAASGSGGLNVYVDGKVEDAEDLRRTMDWWYRTRGY